MNLRPNRSLIPRLAAVLLASWALGGCATSRGIIDVRPKVVPAPTSGPMVSLDSVADRRHFELAPRDPSTPSLKDNRINDTSITSRAIARKRNGYGMALGDVLLPAGRTVTDLTRETLTSALHDRGYRVVVPSATGSREVSGLNVEILEFWAWFTPGFWAAHLECRIHLRATEAASPSRPAREFKGYVRLATQAATGDAWKNTVDKAIDSLVRDIETQLAAAPIQPPVPAQAAVPAAVPTPQGPAGTKAPPGARFDPYTGKPLQPRFDPYTGQPLAR